MGTFISIIISILLMILEYKMLCHLVTRSMLDDEDKKGWILGFVIFTGLASIAYYFSEYRKDNKNKDIE